MNSSGAYLMGRRAAEAWPEPMSSVKNLIFAAELKDNDTLDSLKFEHCTFANISFKEAELNQCSFINCVFLDCYFRKCQLIGSAFIGCKFQSCDFPRATIQSCDFKYSRFSDCILPFDEMEHSLPREPNLREELSLGLALAADGIGQYGDGRKYRLAAIQAKEENLRAAVLGKSEWYQTHYQGLRKVNAFFRLMSSLAIGTIWGHGEKWTVLMRNLLILAFMILPGCLWFVRGELEANSGTMGIGQIVWLSITTLVPVGGVNSVVATGIWSRAILVTGACLGVVIAGLFVTLIARRMLK